MEVILYDQYGKPGAYLDKADEDTIWIWGGLAVAYLERNIIFGWNGKHLGWFIDNILYDLEGFRVGYTAETSPHRLMSEPFKPFKRFKRFKLFQRQTKSMRVLKNSTSYTKLKDLLELGWVK